MTGLDEHDAVLDRVATPQRAASVIADLLGPRVDFGPVAVGPHAMATATATGPVGRIRARRTAPGRGVVTVPARLDVTVLIGRREVPVDVELAVRVGLAARLVGDVVAVDVAPIEAGDVHVDARTSGVGGVFLRRFADLEGEIRHHVGVYVSTLLESERAIAATRLPV